MIVSFLRVGLVAWVWLIPGFCVAAAGGQEVTVPDLIDGILARRSGVADIRLRYSIELQRTDFYYDLWRRDLKRDLHARYGQGEQIPEAPPGHKKAGERLPETERPPEKVLKAYRVLMRDDGKVAYEIYDTEGTGKTESPVVKEKAVFDGELTTALLPAEKRGTIGPTASERAIPFQRIGTLFHAERQDLSVYLQREDVAAEVLATRVEEGDVLVDVRTRRIYEDQRYTVTHEYLITFNTSKSYWPISVQGKATQRLRSDDAEIEIPTWETTVERFHEVNGSYYPASIVQKEYRFDSTLTPKPKLNRVDVTTIRRLAVESVAINEGIADEEFVLEFPSGTNYYDYRDDSNYVVDGAGTVVKLATDMRLPESKYTREEAFAILRQRRAERQRQETASSFGMQRSLLVYGSIILICGLAGFFIVNRIRKRDTQ